MSMDTKTLADKLKAAPYVTGPSGMSVVLTDNQGNLGKMTYNNFRYVNLNNKEEPKLTITLKEFIKKYIPDDSPAGMCLTDMSYADSVKWDIELKPGLNVSPQDYMILVTKVSRNVDSPWCCISLMMLPARPSLKMYSVFYTTGAIPNNSEIVVKEADLTDV